MESFLENSKLIFANIETLRKLVKSSQQYTSLKQTSVMTEDQEAVVDRKIEELDINFDKICGAIKDAIHAAQEETNRLEKEDMIDKAELEMRNLHIHKFFKELKQTIFTYRNSKSDFKNKEKDLLKQAYQIVNPKANENEIEKILNEPDSDTALSSAFSLGGNSAKKMLETAKNRRKKIDRIVVIINRLVALIEEIDNMVKSNATVVDDIVINMTQSEKHTAQANKELERSLVYQRRINFIKKLALGLFGLLILGLILWFGVSSALSSNYLRGGNNPRGGNNGSGGNGSNN
jgi:t-SNARE complex subunit (syntaxin)